MTYTIYRGTKPNGDEKIGCDEAYPNRPIKQNLTNYYIVEEHTDEMVASRREKECQKEAGLPVDINPYHLRKVRLNTKNTKEHNINIALCKSKLLESANIIRDRFKEWNGIKYHFELEIAREYNVSRSTINRILREVTY